MSSKRRDRQRYSGLTAGGRLDPKVAEMLQDAVPNKAALTAKQKRDRQRKRVMYDIDPTIKAVVQSFAKREDTSASQFVEILLAFGLRAYLRGDPELKQAMSLETRKRSRTPRFYWDLALPDEWMLMLEAYLAEAKKPRKWGQ